MTVCINNVEMIEGWLAVARPGAELLFYDGHIPIDNYTSRDAGFAQVWERLKRAQDARKVYLDFSLNGYTATYIGQRCAAYCSPQTCSYPACMEI